MRPSRAAAYALYGIGKVGKVTSTTAQVTYRLARMTPGRMKHFCNEVQKEYRNIKQVKRADEAVEEYLENKEIKESVDTSWAREVRIGPTKEKNNGRTSVADQEGGVDGPESTGDPESYAGRVAGGGDIRCPGTDIK